MFNNLQPFQIAISFVLIMSFCLAPLGQDLVSYSSIASGSSVFVYRNTPRAAKRVAPARPVRTQVARQQSASRIKKQIETIARTAPKLGREKAIGPDKLPPSRSAMKPVAASKLFAGVGEYYLTLNDLDNALEMFREAKILDADNAAAKMGYSEALALKGNEKLEKYLPKEAKVLFEDALLNNPKNSAAYFGLGEVYAQLDQTADAILSYEKSIENDPKLTEIYVPLGILYFQTGAIAKADDMLSKAIVASPERAETQYFYGLVRASQNRHDDAVAAFQKARAIDPNYSEAYFRAGESLSALKRPGEAVAEYQRAVGLKKDYFEAWFGLGESQLEAGNFADSLTAFTTAKKLRSDSWEAYAGLGDANIKLTKYTDAAGNFDTAATLFMRKPDFNKEIAADLFSKKGFAIGQQCPLNQKMFVPCQWPAAIKALEKAVELSGKPFDYTNLGWAYFNASRIDRDNKLIAEQKAKLDLAKIALQKAMDADPQLIDAVQNFGVVQNDLGDFRSAIETFKRVIDKQPDWAFAKYALGSAYFALGDYDNAAAALRAALEKDPNYIAALSSLGSLAVKRKDLKEANKILDELRQKNALDAAAQLEQEIRLSGFKRK